MVSLLSRALGDFRQSSFLRWCGGTVTRLVVDSGPRRMESVHLCMGEISYESWSFFSLTHELAADIALSCLATSNPIPCRHVNYWGLKMDSKLMRSFSLTEPKHGMLLSSDGLGTPVFTFTAGTPCCSPCGIPSGLGGGWVRR